MGDSLICGEFSIVLKSKYTENGTKYEWSTCATTSEISISRGGTFVLKVYNDFGCVDYDTLVVRGAVINAGFSDINQGNIGDICAGDLKEFKIRFSNYSLDSISIIDARIDNVYSFIKIINKNDVISKINGQSFVDINLAIQSNALQIISDTLKILAKDDNCEMSFQFPINSKIISITNVSAPKYQQEPGDHICFPLNSSINCNTDITQTSDFKAIIKFDSEYFYPEEIHGVELEDNYIYEGFRYLKLKGLSKSVNNNTSVLAEICGTVLVGGDALVPININQFNWSDSLMRVNTVDGSIKVVACAVPIRPIQYFKPTGIQVKQNPSGEIINIEFSSQTKGNYTIELVDYSGNIIKKLPISKYDNNISVTEIEMNTKNLSNGVYFLLLNGEEKFISTKIFILK